MQYGNHKHHPWGLQGQPAASDSDSRRDNEPDPAAHMPQRTRKPPAKTEYIMRKPIAMKGFCSLQGLPCRGFYMRSLSGVFNLLFINSVFLARASRGRARGRFVIPEGLALDLRGGPRRTPAGRKVSHPAGCLMRAVCLTRAQRLTGWSAAGTQFVPSSAAVVIKRETGLHMARH